MNPKKPRSKKLAPDQFDWVGDLVKVIAGVTDPVTLREIRVATKQELIDRIHQYV